MVWVAPGGAWIMLGKIFKYLLLHGVVPGLFLAGGWYTGAKYGAPELLIRAIDGAAIRLYDITAPLLSRGAERGGEVVRDAAQQGGEYVAGTVEQMLEELAEPRTIPEEPEPAEAQSEPEVAEPEVAEIEETQPAEQASTPADGGDDQKLASAGPVEPAPKSAPTPVPEKSTPVPAPVREPSYSADGELALCGGMTVRNAPRTGADGVIGPSDKIARLDGISLLLMPATNACLSSGYGSRGGKLHRGVDYYSKTGGNVLAGGSGVIVEAVTRSDYGNMVVIDHGNGVYTRYAHLARFASGVRDGTSVSAGTVLGPIGNSGATGIVHLHYEVLTGDIETKARSFGLTTVDPFSL